MEVTLYFLQLLLQVAVEVVQAQMVLLVVRAAALVITLFQAVLQAHQEKVMLAGLQTTGPAVAVVLVEGVPLVHLEILEDKAVMVLRRSMA
jgi:hypothetical protein